MEDDGLTCEYSQNRETPSPGFNITPSKSDSSKELTGQKYSEMDESYVVPSFRANGTTRC